MFTLIITLYVFFNGPAVGLVSVPGFQTQAACEAAGQAWTQQQNKVAKHLCVSLQ
ncbi:MAG TPA: hypothetical protein VGO37_05780 [Steroidobacteraceae bacterium]|jgi:hypothetical protein|nr:hypothetical protein [Steroidobacteraceae bacterium]